MKKILALFILLSSILGCNYKQNTEYDIQSFDLTKLSQISDTEYEILRVTPNQIILNELDTFNNPFLFTTKSIVILNQDGQQNNKYTITTHKRIVDFIEYKDIYIISILLKKIKNFILNYVYLKTIRKK